jgi:PAS domain S-box-containing protein
MLLAEVDGTVAGLVTAFVAAFATLVGAMVWLLKHLFQTTLPEQAKTFAEDKASQGRAFSDALDKIMAHCEAEAKQERAATEQRHREGMEAAHRGLVEIVGLIKQNDTKLLEAMNQVHIDQRDTVHAVKNLTHAISLKSQVADAVFNANVAVWTKTAEGVLTSWNPAAERVLGWTHGDVMGRSVFDTIVPHDRRAEEEDVLRRIAVGETVGEYETVRRGKDGRRVRLAIVSSPIRDQMGKVTGASTIAREV